MIILGNFIHFVRIDFGDHYCSLCKNRNGCAIMPMKPRTHSITRRQRDERPSASRRGYGRKWKRLRILYLKRHPICENPFEITDHIVPATDVDHIIPKRRGGPDRWENLQALCHSCHSSKTRLEQQDRLKINYRGTESIEQVKLILAQQFKGRGDDNL